MTTPLLFVDLETTGLDPRTRWAGILELGLRLVDGDDLDVVQSASWVVTYRPATVATMRAAADDYVRGMHDASGLWRECSRLDPAPIHPFTDALQWVRMVAADPAIPLCGSSVHFDRGWLAVHLPRILEGRTHRLADVSSMREILLRFGEPGRALVEARPRPQEAAHRVDADLDATLAELRHYRAGIVPGLAS